MQRLLRDISACRVCEKHLPLGPRPVVQVGKKARIVIVGQAPGTKVHESGKPWEDASGDHLREWLSIDAGDFYDAEKVALMPMGFCYPGKSKGGDAPPRPECAPLWHTRLLNQLPADVLIVLVGQYAHRYYLATSKKATLTETVKSFQSYLPKYFALPHPSWRSKIWMKKNAWFAKEVLPCLRDLVSKRLS